MKHLRRLSTITLSLLLSACAPMINSVPSQIAQETSSGASPSQLPVEVAIQLSTGYRRTLSPQTRWQRVGRLPQGTVYRPIDTVFSIEGRQVHEAYLVVKDDALIGFYLPAESRYSPLEPFVNLPKGAFQ